MIGYKEGLIVFFVDSTKGALSIALAILIGIEGEWLLIPGVFSVLGHLYPIFLRFKGGGGLATMIGIGAVLFPVPTAIGSIPGLMILMISHHTGISATIGVMIAIGFALNQGYSGIVVLGYFFIGVVILVRIRAHIYMSTRKMDKLSMKSD
jgi:glycerol-3-phosphate acyltransferase PlsY